MKRKLIWVGIGTLLIAAVVVFVAGRGSWGNAERRTRDELVLTPEGKLVVQPGERAKMTVVVGENAGRKSTSNPPPR